MTSREFCYWLQGYFEIHSIKVGSSISLTAEETECIKKHLALVFKHEIDPSYPNQDELNKIHNSHLTGQKESDDFLVRC